MKKIDIYRKARLFPIIVMIVLFTAAMSTDSVSAAYQVRVILLIST